MHFRFNPYISNNVSDQTMQGLPPYYENRWAGQHIREGMMHPHHHQNAMPKLVVPECASEAGSSATTHISLPVRRREPTEYDNCSYSISSTHVTLESNDSSKDIFVNSNKRVKYILPDDDDDDDIVQAGNQDEDPVYTLKVYYKCHSHRSLLRGDQNFVYCADTLNGGYAYTCYFVSPECEFFPSGILKTRREATTDCCYIDYHKGLHWYSTHEAAKKAAAGKAIDCFEFRSAVVVNNNVDGSSVVSPAVIRRRRKRRHFCVDEPYLLRQKQIALPELYYPHFAKRINDILYDKILKH